MRRPLFSVLAAAAAAIGISVLIIPWSPFDYEPWRDCTVDLTGTICGMEPALEGEGIVWKVTLSDLSEPVISEIEGKESPKPASESDKPSFGNADLSLNGTGESGKANTVITGTGKRVRTTPAFTGTGKSGSFFRPVSSGSGFEKRSRVLCVMESQPAADMSARVRVRGRLSPFRRARNEGTFDLCRYYHILRVEFSVRDAEILAVSPPTDRLAAILYSLKRILSAGADRVFTVENAPVVKAVLLGEKGLLDDDTKELYQGVGIIHIFSISGIEKEASWICAQGRKPHNYAVFRLSVHFWHMISDRFLPKSGGGILSRISLLFQGSIPWGKRQLVRIPWGKSI